jgi:uncharacterized DUF497 family protein
VRIAKVLIEEHIKRKIFEKHSVEQEEIKDGLLQGKPVVFKTKEERYLTITKHHRHITIIFTYDQQNAQIVTAYPSSQWQIKLYKKKM